MSPPVPARCTAHERQVTNRAHLRNPAVDLYRLVTFHPGLVKVWNIKPEIMVVTEVLVERAQLRVRYWCVVYGDLDHVQQFQPIGGRIHIKMCLFG